jgi:hypothetical protein
MKAEQRKEIETNSLIHAVQKMREHVTGRTLYYVIGTLALVIGGILLYRYLTGEKGRARDAGLIQLINADTAEKLKQGMEDHRGTILGSLFKLHLARHLLLDEGLPKLGTDSGTARNQAAASVEQARGHYLDLTNELKQKDEPSLVQEAWLGAAQAEEALVGLPTAEGGTDSRGNVDKVIEYYEKAAAIFPDSEMSKRYKTTVDKIKANKDQFVATQKAIYKPREVLPLGPPKKGDPFGFGTPGLPKLDSGLPKIEPPPALKGETPPSSTTTTVPPPPAPPPAADPKKTPDPKPAETPKADPKAK